jgi:hypothetical protein
MDDPTVAEALRLHLSQVPKSEALSAGYDVAAGLARFEAALGMTAAGSGAASSGTAASPTGGPGAVNSATGNAALASSAAGHGVGAAAGSGAAGSGITAGVGAAAGLKGLLIAGVGACLIAGAAVGGYQFYGRSSAASADAANPELVIAPAQVPVGARSVAVSAPAPPAVVASESVARDTDLDLVAEAHAEKPRTAPSAVVSARTDKVLVPSVSAPSIEEPPTAVGKSRSTDLTEEMEQLARLRSVASSDPSAALRLANEGEQRFAKGLFRQEREAIAIQALGQLNRTSEAKQRARAFKAAYPRSPFLVRMNQWLVGDAE